VAAVSPQVVPLIDGSAVPPIGTVLSENGEKALIERVTTAVSVTADRALTMHMTSLDQLTAAVAVTALLLAFSLGVAAGVALS
jgi:hypothetical protein